MVKSNTTLGTAGISRAVVEAPTGFETVVLQRPPQMMALSSPRDATGLFELQAAQADELLRPFEGMGAAAMRPAVRTSGWRLPARGNWP